MKILHFITSLRVGGAEIALCNLLEHWHEQGLENSHHVAYLYDGPCIERIKALGIPTHHVDGVVSPYDFLSFIRLSKLVKKIKPDIIHSALWSANIMARFISKFHKIPLICDLHGDCRYHGRLRNFFENMTLGIPDHFVAVSDSVSRSFIEMFGLNRQTTVIQNGIDCKKICKKDLYIHGRLRLSKDSQDSFVIGSVGRLHKIKRYDFLIESFAMFLHKNKFKKIYLYLVGDGPEKDFLYDLVKKLGIENHVLFMGEQQDVYKFYNCFDCFVLPSQSEGLSIALLEAMSFGLPIVTTGINKKHDVVTDGVNGLVVSCGDKKMLCNAFEMLDMNKALRFSMSRENLVLVEEKFNIRRVANEYIKLYTRLIN